MKFNFQIFYYFIIFITIFLRTYNAIHVKQRLKPRVDLQFPRCFSESVIQMSHTHTRTHACTDRHTNTCALPRTLFEKSPTFFFFFLPCVRRNRRNNMVEDLRASLATYW